MFTTELKELNTTQRDTAFLFEVKEVAPAAGGDGMFKEGIFSLTLRHVTYRADI